MLTKDLKKLYLMKIYTSKADVEPSIKNFSITLKSQGLQKSKSQITLATVRLEKDCATIQ